MRPRVAACLFIAICSVSIGAQQGETVYDGPFDAANRLVIKRGSSGHLLHVLLIDRTDASKQSEIDTIVEDNSEYTYEVTRADRSTVVVCRTESHGFEAGCFKLFLDPAARRLVKRVSFDRRQDVAFADDTAAQRLLGLSAQDLDTLKKQMLFSATAPDRQPPEVFATYPLPRSTYPAFARARPTRVQDGYREAVTRIKEEIGAWQTDEGGFWFAKTFYDGEGRTGIGGVGLLSRSGQYSYLTIPAVFDWSVDAILVEPDALWAGLVNHGEGPDTSGGLLRYDRKTQRSEIQGVPGVILRIAHVADAVFLGTTRGLYVVRNGTLTWHHMEPDVNGRPVVITETIPK